MTAKTSGKPHSGGPRSITACPSRTVPSLALRREGFSLSGIARRLEVARSSVTREVRRNASHRGYRYLYADAMPRHGSPATKASRATRGQIACFISLPKTHPRRGHTRGCCVRLSHTERMAMSAGVTPDTREAWPRSRGRTAESFSRDS